MGRLGDLISLWTTQGVKLWLQNDLEIPLVAGQAMYSLKPGGDVDMTKPLRVLPQGYYLDSSNNKRPLWGISREEYTRLSRTVQTGAISQFWVDKRVAEVDVYFWLVPDATAATGTAHVITQYQATRFTSLTETMDFPQEWFIALRWGLADDVSTGQPQSIIERCRGMATTYRQALEDWDVEDADTRFAVDTTRAGAPRRFR